MNFFDYATKELAQDAFLRWLFENWQDSRFYPIVHHLLENFCNISVDDRVEISKTYAQWKNSDVRIDFSLAQKEKMALLIEDKTFSTEHDDQLNRYNWAVNELEKEKAYVFKVYYKTSVIDDWEAQRVKTAGWEQYDLKRILSLFLPFDHSGIFLVDEYIKHLKDLVKLYANTSKPDYSDNQKDYVSWSAFFRNTIIPKLPHNLCGTQFEIYPCIIHYGYSCLIIVRECDKPQITPYIEIRSRDCLKTNFKALVLGYGIEEPLLKKKAPAVTKTSETSNFWQTKYQRHKADKSPKQMCYYETQINQGSIVEFIKKTVECMEHYVDLLEAWDNA